MTSVGGQVTLRLSRVRERGARRHGAPDARRICRSVGDEVQLNGRPHVVRSVEFGGGEHVLQLHAK